MLANFKINSNAYLLFDILKNNEFKNYDFIYAFSEIKNAKLSFEDLISDEKDNRKYKNILDIINEVYDSF